MTDAKGVPKPDVVERTLRPDEVETPKRLLRTSHISDDCADARRKPALRDGRLQPFDARCMAVNRHDGTRREFDELEGLPADSAPQVEDRRGLWKFTAKTKGPCGASTVTGALPGKGFVDLEEDLPETRARLVHEYSLSLLLERVLQLRSPGWRGGCSAAAVTAKTASCKRWLDWLHSTSE